MQEVFLGEPFLGPSGRLMEEVLKRYGIAREEVFLANTVSCNPERNVDPPKDAITACSARLREELATRETIVTLGNIATKFVLGTNDGILKTRVGPPKHSERFPRARIVPTVHPAAALRSADYFPFIVSDFAKITKESREWSPPSYGIPTTDEEALQAIRFLKGFSKLAVDIETATEKDLAYERPEKYQILCVGVAHSAHSAIVFTDAVLGSEVVRWEFGELLGSAKLIAQNGKFDIPALKTQFGECSLYFDTMLASYSIDERGGIHGLKAMAREHLGAPDYSADIKQYTGKGRDFAAIPRDVLYRYNANDCTLTYELYELFSRELDNQGLRHLHDFLVRVANALISIEHEGIGVDHVYLQKLDRVFGDRLSTQEASLQQWTKNPRSPLQVKAALAKLRVTTASTDVRHLQDILEGVAAYSGVREADEVAEFVKQLLAYRKDSKLHGTYIKGIEKRLWQGRIYPTYLLHGTTSGRLSCRNPNIQNVPRGSEIKSIFVPEDGNIFIQADFKQGELRVVATLSGDEYLINSFASGEDFIGDLAARLFGPANAKKMRTKTKNITYGSLYGMILGKGKQGVAYAKLIGMPNDEAYRYQQRLFELIPGIPKWQEETRKRVMAGETLTTYTGRRRRFFLITEENKKDILNECLAFKPQSTLSDICVTGLCELVDAGYHPRITVHDSIVIECERDRAEEVQGVMNEVLPRAARAFTTRVPFEVEFKSGTNWGDIS